MDQKERKKEKEEKNTRFDNISEATSKQFLDTRSVRYLLESYLGVVQISATEHVCIHYLL